MIEKKAKTSNRIFYYDAIRAFAILAVIIYHISNTVDFLLLKNAFSTTSNTLIYYFMNNFFKTGVNLFLMLSGALLLGRKYESIKSFLTKRLPRITLPFIFWGLTISILLIGIVYLFPNKLTTLSVYNLDIVTTLSLKNILNFIFDSFLAKPRWFKPFWFFWLILGLYLILPLINKLILNSNLEEIEYYLVIWILSCFIFNTLKISFPLHLEYFSGYLGLTILGYYLVNSPRKFINSIYCSIIFIMIFGLLSILIAYYTHAFNPYGDLNILIIFLSTGIFLFFKNFNQLNIHWGFIKNPESTLRKFISDLSKYSYGIYLMHRFIIFILFILFIIIIIFKRLILILFIVMFIICFAIMNLLNKIPIINRLIVSK